MTLHVVGVVADVEVELDAVVGVEVVVSIETSLMMRIHLLPMLVKVLLMERVGEKGLAMVGLVVLIVVVVGDVEVSVMGKLVKMGNHGESMNVAVGLDAGNCDSCSRFLGCWIDFWILY